MKRRALLLTPHSSLRTPHSSLLTPRSALLTPHSSLLAPDSERTHQHQQRRRRRRLGPEPRPSGTGTGTGTGAHARSIDPRTALGWCTDGLRLVRGPSALAGAARATTDWEGRRLVKSARKGVAKALQGGSFRRAFVPRLLARGSRRVVLFSRLSGDACALLRLRLGRPDAALAGPVRESGAAWPRLVSLVAAPLPSARRSRAAGSRRAPWSPQRRGRAPRGRAAPCASPTRRSCR